MPMNLACTVRRLRFSATTLLALGMLFPASGSAQIKSTLDESGKRVFVNDEESVPNHTVSRSGQRYSKSLVYWSNTEHRWKAVPVPPPAMMRAARSAVAEVNSALAAQPKSSGNGQVAPEDPSYAKLARAYNVTSEEIESAINAAAERHDLDPNLVKALIKVESNFNPKAVSHKGAMGLMQLMPATARSLNVSNPFDPQQNVDAGVRHLKGLLQNFGGDVRLSLAAYNAGQGAVMRNGGIPPYRETQNYVQRITTLYTGGLNVAVSNPVRRPIKVSRDERGILTFNNVD